MNIETATLSGGVTQFDETARKLFEGAEIRLQTETYRRKSDQAKREQRRLYWMVKALNLLVLAVGVLSGFLLAVAIVKGWALDPARPIPWLVAYADPVKTALVVLIILCTVFASAMGRILHEGDSLARYRKLRSEAEVARTGRFTTLARQAAALGSGPALEALRMIRDDLLEDQRAYYLRRAEEHRASLAATGRWAALGIILSALASIAAVTVLSNALTAPLLVLGVIAAAFSAFAIDREGLNRDRANAELYDLTAERLGGLTAGVEKVEAEVTGGNPGAVSVFADLVSAELQHEHQRWVAGLDVTSQLLSRLEERLAEAKSRGEAIERTAEPPPGKAGHATAAAPPSAIDAPAPVSEPAVGPAVEPAVELAPETTPDGVAPEPAPDPPAMPVSVTEPVSGPMPPPQELAATLGRWTPVLMAAATVLPTAQARQAQTLLDEVGALAPSLAALQPSLDVVARARRLATLLERGGPVADWLAAGSDVAGLVMPPAAILLGAAGIAARLGEDAYRRWVASVLDAPVPPALIRAAAIDVTAVMAALERAPIFAAALETPRRDRDGAALLSFVSRALDDPDALWPDVAARFDDDRANFDAGIGEMAKALLGPAVRADLAEVTTPDGPTAAQIETLAADAQAGPLLRTAVLLLHEIRAEGGAGAAQILVAGLVGKAGT